MMNKDKFFIAILSQTLLLKTVKYGVCLYCVALLLHQPVVSMQGVRHKLSLENACKQFDRGKLVRYP